MSPGRSIGSVRTKSLELWDGLRKEGICQLSRVIRNPWRKVKVKWDDSCKAHSMALQKVHVKLELNNTFILEQSVIPIHRSSFL